MYNMLYFTWVLFPCSACYMGFLILVPNAVLSCGYPFLLCLCSAFFVWVLRPCSAYAVHSLCGRSAPAVLMQCILCVGAVPLQCLCSAFFVWALRPYSAWTPFCSQAKLNTGFL